MPEGLTESSSESSSGGSGDLSFGGSIGCSTGSKENKNELSVDFSLGDTTESSSDSSLGGSTESPECSSEGSGGLSSLLKLLLHIVFMINSSVLQIIFILRVIKLLFQFFFNLSGF